MKQFIKSILGIGAITIFIGILYAGLNKAQSEESFPPGLMTVQPVPAHCGNSFEVLLVTMKNFGMKFVGSGDVREKGLDTGALLGTMSFWHNEMTKKGVFYMTVPMTNQTCLLSYGVNWQFDENVLLEIVNTEIANQSKLETE